METLLEKTDPVEEGRKREMSMSILRKNMAEREAKLKAIAIENARPNSHHYTKFQ